MLLPTKIALPKGELSFLSQGEPDHPLLLCLHGFPDTPRTFLPLFGALSGAGYRVVAPWLRGYAPSTRQGPFSLDHLAEDILALAAALSPEQPFSLIGHDWGALITYTALSLAPERVHRAVTLAVPHPLAFLQNLPRYPAQLRRSWYIAFFQLGRVADRALARDHFALLERLWRDWSPGFSLLPEEMEDRKRCFQESMPAPVAYYRSLFRPSRALLRLFLSASSRKIPTPTLYLHGARDGCIGPALARGQECFFEELKTRIIEDAGHFLHLERPDLIAEEILHWLSEA